MQGSGTGRTRLYRGRARSSVATRFQSNWSPASKQTSRWPMSHR